MSTKHLTAYIDIGTETTRVAFFDYTQKKNPRLSSIGFSKSKGVRHGYILQQEEATKSLQKAMSSKNGTTDVEQAVISIGGKGLENIITTGTAVISKSDQEVTQFDIDKAINEAESMAELQNRKIIFQSPILYKIDGKEVLGKPDKLKGIKLEVKMLFVTCLVQQLDDLIETVSATGLDVIDVVPSPIASAMIALSETQKTAGVVLVDIGAETTSFVVYENGIPIWLHVLPFGGNHITNDIALGLRVSLEEAEKIKHGLHEKFSQRKLNDIVEARLSEIFELVDKHLKRLGRSGMLPAGIVLVGNGCLHPLTKSIAEKVLAIPARIANLETEHEIKIKLKDNGWFPAIGLPFASTIQKKPKEGFWGECRKLFKSAISQLTP